MKKPFVFISYSTKDSDTANLVYSYLEGNGIPCWIASRNIEGGESFAVQIVDAINDCEAFVIISSANSNDSPHVNNELSIAFGKGTKIIPFRIEDFTLSKTSFYYFQQVQWIDACSDLEEGLRHLLVAVRTVITLEEKHNEQYNKKHATNSTNKLISTPYEIPNSIFLGREETLHQIDNHFSSGERILFLHGIGGIGKTQIAKQYAKLYRHKYDTVIFCTYNGSIKDLVIAERPFELEAGLIRYTMSDGSQESDDAFFARKIEQIQKLSDERTLIIIDNYDVEYDEYFEYLTHGRFHLLVTTRYNSCSHRFPNIEIKAIDSIAVLKQIFMKNYGGYTVSEDDAYLSELIKMVNCHTYTIELLALHMENSGQSTREMIDALKKYGIVSLNEEVSINMTTQIAYKNLLAIFKIASLNEQETKIMMYLSLMPIEGVRVSDFIQWANLHSHKQLRDLERKKWIIPGETTGSIALHPIIRSVVAHEASANENNCYSFILSFVQTIDEDASFHYEITKKRMYASIAKEMLDIFKDITPITVNLYHHAQSLFSYSVDPNKAIELATRLYDYYSSLPGENSFKIGHSAFKIGWAYSFNYHLPNAINEAKKWLNIALKTINSDTLVSYKDQAMYAQIYTNLSKMHLFIYESKHDETDYNLSDEYANNAYKHVIQSIPETDTQYAKAAGALMQSAKILFMKERYSDALEKSEEAVNILVRLFTENDVDSMHALSRKAVALYHLGQLSEAKLLAQKSAAGYSGFVGINHPIVCSTYVLIGDCCTSLGEIEEANVAYNQALKIAKVIFSSNSQQIIDITERLDQSVKESNTNIRTSRWWYMF